MLTSQSQTHLLEEADIDGNALATEMETLPEFPKAIMTPLYPHKFQA